MPKRSIQDMVRVKRKIPEIAKEAPRREPKKEIEEVGKVQEVVRTMGQRTNHTSNRSRYFLWSVALVSVVFCFFAISFLFAKADVLINPKMQDVVLSENLTANKDSSTGGLSFDTVTIPGEESKKIQATGEKDVSVKATGSAIIFNAFGSPPQNLNIDTRLEGSNGKIYRTQSAVIVPGMSKDGTPGQVTVGIYAALPGQEYNSGPLDFKIYGFKGTPKYTKFNVRSKPGTQITGGFIGRAPDVSPEDKASAVTELKTAMQVDLLKKATVQIPDGFILFKDAVSLTTDDANLTIVSNPDSTATITLKGALSGIILSEKELTKKIAEDNINKYDQSEVYIPKIKALTFSMPSLSTAGTQVDSSVNTVPLVDSPSINFSLSGPAKIVWRLDIAKFTSNLLGKSKSDFNRILSQYPNIDSATLTLSPIWKISMPEQASDVKVIVNYPK